MNKLFYINIMLAAANAVAAVKTGEPVFYLFSASSMIGACIASLLHERALANKEKK